MSRLRVGNITIDGRNVTIDEPNPGLGAGSTARGLQQPGNAAAIQLLDRVPLPPSVLAGGGVVLTVAGTVANVLLGVFDDPVGALLRGGMLAPLGAGLLAVGIAKMFVARRPDLRHAASLGPAAAPYVEELAALLRNRDVKQTVPWIVQRSGWPEDRVLRVLALMRSRGLIVEDMDPDTGEFFYFPEPTPTPRDLDTRLGELSP